MKSQVACTNLLTSSRTRSIAPKGCATLPALVRGQTTSLAALVALAGAALASLLPPPAGADSSPALLRGKAKALREHNSLLAARSNAAVLGLFALDSRLDRSRRQISVLRGQARSLQRLRAEERRQLRKAHRAVVRLKGMLAQRVRALYEQGANEPLAVLLAANSLGEARSGIARLVRTARGNQELIAEIRARRELAARLGRSLRERRAQIARLEAAARRASSALARARLERKNYVGWLLSVRRARTAEISAVEAEARALEARAAAASAGPLPAGLVPAEQPAVPQALAAGVLPAVPPGGGRLLTVTATAYSLPGHTASGLPVGPGIVAVDPAVIPLGTRLTIPGYGSGLAADTGLAVRGATIDLWFPTVTQALAWGRRTVTIVVH